MTQEPLPLSDEEEATAFVARWHELAKSSGKPNWTWQEMKQALDDRLDAERGDHIEALAWLAVYGQWLGAAEGLA